MSELNIYLLPGMGADKRLYDPIGLTVGKHHFIEWEHIPEAITLTDYAEHLVSNIRTENNVYIGSSMGGMMAVEMQHLKPSDRLILLSAPASRDEFPPLLNRVRDLRMGKWFNPNQLYKLNRLADTFMGFKDKDDRQLFYEMLEGYGPEFLHYAVNAILNWDQRKRPDNYFQIIGDKDALFKQKRMIDPVMVQGSGHFMTFEQPKILTDLLNQELRRIEKNLS